MYKFINLNFTGLYIPIVPLFAMDLAVNIVPSLTIDFCLRLGFKVEYESGNSSLLIGVFISAYAGISLNLGLYIPSGVCLLHFEFSIGFEGVLGEGKVGLDLIFYFNEEYKKIYSLDFYYSIEAIKISFFIKVGIYFSFKLGFIKFNWSFSYTIYEIELFTLFTRNYHKILDLLIKNSDIVGCTEIISQAFLKTPKDNDGDNTNQKDCL